MNRRSILVLLAAVLALFLVPVRLAGAAVDTPPERTLSPYFFVQDGDSSIDRLPLRDTNVKVTVSGVIASVTVRQTYKNDGQRPLHATYVFPASMRAAVHGMRMKVAGQTIHAKVREKQQARREFEAAKREGKTASLLEQQRPNVFSMSVGNIMPGDVIEVELDYTEMLVPTEGVYEFVYPAVVGPRYSSVPERSADEADAWVKSPYLREGQASPNTFHLEATLSAPVPLLGVSVPTHKVTQVWQEPKVVRLTLDPSEARGNNRDFVARYRLTGTAIQSGISLYDGGVERFFLAVVQPPERLAAEQMPPREYVFVVDVSGSMHGFPLDTSKALLKSLVGGLRPIDKFNVLLFSGGSSLLSPASLPASRSNIDAAVRAIDSVDAGGGTELDAALLRAASLPRQAGVSRSFVVVTDGYIAAEGQVFRHIRSSLNDANVFCFGIGSSVNRYLVEGIARAGLGEPFVVTEPGQAPAVSKRFRDYIASPVLTNIRVAFQDFETYDVEPSSIPDVLAARPVLVFGKWRGSAKGRVVVSGAHGRGSFRQTLEVSAVSPLQDNSALSFLWARSRLADLSDFAGEQPSDAERQQIVRLGLGYNLLTQFTSFVAVAQTVRNARGIADDVETPLPLPLGVSNYAVGSPVVGADEPGLVALLVLVGLFGLLALSRRGSKHEAPAV